MTQPYYPIGLQSFSEMRRLRAVYVDKTALVYQLVHSSKFVFLSRPRRFGKTLLTSTLQCYFEGRKELFAGLAIERMEKDWTAYPVLRFDLSTAKSDDLDEVTDNLSYQIRQYEAEYGKDDANVSLSSRMTDIIKRAKAKTGKNVVVLIDEYDAPILEVMHNEEKRESVRKLLRKFFSPLKSCDDQLHFVFLTGISMFSQLSIFSELNNLDIISRNREYASICGITEQELVENFHYGIQQLAAKYEVESEEMVRRLKDAYDGYHFCENSEGLLNPFSVLNAFKNNELGRYWFRSGTPSSLIRMLKTYQQEGKFNVDMLESPKQVTAAKFEMPLEMQSGPMPLLYQAGYITIKGYDRETSLYTLGVPNTEVRIGLLQNLLPLYADVDSEDVESMVIRASIAFKKGEPDKAIELFRAMLASIPYMRGDKDILSDSERTEAYYHRIFYFFFRMLYNEVSAEVRSAKGAADIVIKTPHYIYIVEIKIDSSADAALQQIDDNGYATPYLADGRKVVKLGVNFSTNIRTVNEWAVAK